MIYFQIFMNFGYRSLKNSKFFTPNASENAPRTTEACFLHRAHIPYHRRPSPVPNFSNCQKKESIACTEYNKCQKGRCPLRYGALKIHPRTIGVRFRYRISLPYRRSLFFTPNASENASRTTEACFLHRAHIPYQRRPSPVPNFSNCQKKESISRTECLWPLYQRSGAVTPMEYDSGMAGKRKRTNRHF